MGANQSKEELLYQKAQNGNHDAVKKLRREGTSLEWVDKKGRTSLIMACNRGDLLDMVITLLNLGANINGYRAGAHGGFPLHHAAKRGLEKTVTLLISRGANPLAVNDDGNTALDMARSRGHVAVVRLLEEKLCLFSGMLRELSGFSILEFLAPKWITKRVWGVVLPTKSSARGPPVCELALYEAPKVRLWNGVNSSSTHPAGLCNVAQPQTRISVANVDIEEPNFTLSDPVLVIMDKSHKKKYKFYAETKGDKAQLKRFCIACRAMSLAQTSTLCGNDINSHSAGHTASSHQQGNPSQIHPMRLQTSSAGRQPVLQSVLALSSGVSSTVDPHALFAEPIREELALALALKESVCTAAEHGIPSSPISSNVSSIHQPDERGIPNEIYRGWSPSEVKMQQDARPMVANDYNRWKAEQLCLHDSSVGEQPVGAPPSAPPLPEMVVGVGTCVVCWDARAEGACIPCGHLAGCMTCLQDVRSKSWNCPVCRGPIEQVIRVYAV